MRTLWIFLRWGLSGVLPLSRCPSIHGKRFGLRLALSIRWDVCRQYATKTGYWEESNA